MSGEAWVGLIFACLASGFIGTMVGVSVIAEPYWTFRTKKRELEHTEKMALIKQREKLLGDIK